MSFGHVLETLPYGSWRSAINSSLVGAGDTRIREIQVDGGDIYWLERRPQEGGRQTIVRWSSGTIADALPPEFQASSKVNEYGGGSYLVRAGVTWFANGSDQRVHRLAGAAPEPLTPPDAKLRFADFSLTPDGARLYCVMEDHRKSDLKCVNTLVALDAEQPGEPQVVADGHDFFSAPRVSPDGAHLAWLSWDHPNMPWDGTDLWLAPIHADGRLGNAVHVAGGPEESVCQPRWSPAGELHFVSDRSGWWNLYHWKEGRLDPLCQLEAEFATADWLFGNSNYDFLDDQRLVAAYERDGASHLATIGPGSRIEELDTGFVGFEYVRATGRRAFFVGFSATRPRAVVALTLDSGQQQVLRRFDDSAVPPDLVSPARPIAFPSGGGFTAHALHYAPHNPEFAAPDGDRPPLLVNAHGGPISSAGVGVSAEIAYFTSRGFAYVDVDYRGSTGYGRAYRDALKGEWGIADVEDCVNAAKYLVEAGLADPKRIAIRGGSAGGYTALMALTATDFFSAGASYYGISDAEVMHAESPKFEAMTDLVLYGGEQNLRDRSPIHFADRIRSPLIIFQGLDDPIVPPNQAELMVEVLRRNQVPFAYVPFAGEGHGFRDARNLARAAEAELYFYSRVFGFAPADEIQPVEIENLALD